MIDENENPWFTKDRSETSSNRVHRRVNENIIVENPGLGLNIYKNTFSLDDANRYIGILESNLSGDKKYKWSEAIELIHLETQKKRAEKYQLISV